MVTHVGQERVFTGDNDAPIPSGQGSGVSKNGTPILTPNGVS